MKEHTIEFLTLVHMKGKQEVSTSYNSGTLHPN